ncbi:MAG: VPLPA-CTERM sorting domain-containing protein [Gammaproteobacteria bacterium]|nr:VPLPA-CTERM sorting domain-containing protein [Gammaproteobacteria bacterium]MCW9004508.1 VPLPA-CTERM sorting domain-containing protein [Gammaproteobacteria bacterium]MCW9056054.1 VPLPA-CTERM sorting domain-containing protein [Gammaproteobacteria bacterium]
MKSLKLITIAIGLSTTINVHAASFVSADLLTAGDGLLIEDTTNGLQWADWSQIPGYTSVNDFFSTSTWAGQGFRLATQSDLELLFTTAGADNIGYNSSWFNNPGSGGSASNIAAIELINATTTHQGPSYSDTNGSAWIHSFFDNGGNPATSGMVRFNSESHVDYGAGIIDIILNEEYANTDGNNDERYSVMAVRDIVVVPIPAAVWLFSSGLIGLIGFARSKKA